MSDAHFNNGFIREPAKYDRSVPRASALHRFRCPGVKKNIFLLVCGSGEVPCTLLVTKALFLCTMADRGSSGSRQYTLAVCERDASDRYGGWNTRLFRPK